MALLLNCSAPSRLDTAYDYRLLNAALQPTSLQQVVKSLADKEVVFIGEFHGNHASHLLEMRLFAALHQQNRQREIATVLSMEMFNRDQQTILNRYLAAEVGERYLIEEAPTWSNYQASYRPLIEYAKQHAIPVIAANAPSHIVRCIGNLGESYSQQLPAARRALLAKQPFAPITGYREKFFAAMAHGEHTPEEYLQKSYLAQLSRDNTMAESIAQARVATPQSMVIHINGTFHSENKLGTAGALQGLQPQLRIAVITPRHSVQNALSSAVSPTEKTATKDDFYYLIQAQPEEFVSEEYMYASHRKMFAESKQKAESCTVSTSVEAAK